MKYLKPEVLDLAALMKSSDGQMKPNGCFNGVLANEIGEGCVTGVNAGLACSTGSVGYSFPSCHPGASAGLGYCVSGTVVSSAFACEAGTSGNNDYWGCRNGLSYVSD